MSTPGQTAQCSAGKLEYMRANSLLLRSAAPGTEPFQANLAEAVLGS